MPETGPETQVLDPPPALAESVDLVRRGQAGDSAALGDLVARYQDRVRRILSIRMGAQFRGQIDSLDLTQDACMAALRGLPGLEPRGHGSIIRWLARITENQVLDAADREYAARRDQRRERPADGQDAGSGDGAAKRLPPAPGPTSGERASRPELRAAYDACVAELDAVHRDVILLRDYALLEWPEVCEELGRPSVPATQELHRRARLALGARLRRRLGG
jgi:RNA polymerase sigma factor (sigma-70 family)